MTLVDVGAVFARLLAIMLFISSIKPFAGLYQALQFDMSTTAFFWPEPISKICLAILLWFLPRVAAAIVIPGSIRPKLVGELNASALEKAAFGFLGLYLIVWGIIDMPYHMYILVGSYEPDSLAHAKAGVLATIVQLLLGGWLFFGKGSPYDSIRRLRQA